MNSLHMENLPYFDLFSLIHFNKDRYQSGHFLTK
jgi:hypothetical protein